MCAINSFPVLKSRRATNIFECMQTQTERKLDSSNMPLKSGYIYVGSATGSLRVAIATY